MHAVDISVLYYDENSLVMEKALLRDLKLGPSGRVVLPEQFRQGKSIIAVLGGNVEVLNLVGERAS
ncbi:TIGR02922 family protein [Ferrimonas senticii]|uniref:TIGR02922 family protein n=1 Tax=Ferrimonas senticii TaxID=394566 RepID=UPI0004119F34|nr:TIGR02922 family protein [Ferrimonas senticii]